MWLERLKERICFFASGVDAKGPVVNQGCPNASANSLDVKVWGKNFAVQESWNGKHQAIHVTFDFWLALYPWQHNGVDRWCETWTRSMGELKSRGRRRGGQRRNLTPLLLPLQTWLLKTPDPPAPYQLSLANEANENGCRSATTDQRRTRRANAAFKQACRPFIRPGPLCVMHRRGRLFVLMAAECCWL